MIMRKKSHDEKILRYRMNDFKFAISNMIWSGGWAMIYKSLYDVYRIE